METSENINDLAKMEVKNLCAALADAFGDIEGASKDKSNPAFKSKYADLSAVVDAIKPALVKNGLFFTQVTHEASGGVCVETIVFHKSGEQMSFGKLFVPASKQDAQGFGSALTYCRRYSLMSAFGVAPEDDDGNAAVSSGQRFGAGTPRQQSGPVSADQLSRLQNAADDAGADLGRFCSYMKIESLAALPVNRFDEAMNALSAKQKKAA